MGASAYPGSVWDGTSETRPSKETFREPDGTDWEQARNEQIAVQRQTQPLGIAADGSLRTSTPAGTDEVQSLAVIVSTAGNFTITLDLPDNNPVVTANVGFDGTSSSIQTLINSACAGLIIDGVTYLDNDIVVTGGPINVGAVTLTFSGNSVKKKNIVQVVTTDVSLNDATPPVVSTTTQGITPAADPATTLWNDSGVLKVG